MIGLYRLAKRNLLTRMGSNRLLFLSTNRAQNACSGIKAPLSLYTTRFFGAEDSKKSQDLSWSSPIPEVSEALFHRFSANVEPFEFPVDPRGMQLAQMKRYLISLGFKGDLSKTAENLPLLISHWQKLYDAMVNGNIKLPGNEKAGPLTFSKQNDPEGQKDLHDKDGRRLW